MQKLFNIFIVSSILLASALANVTVYKCVHDGELCVTKSCCPEDKAGNSCCDEKGYSCFSDDECCKEVTIVQDTIFNDVNLNKAKIPDSSNTFTDFISGILIEKDKIFRNAVRGPPQERELSSNIETPEYILYCSFLC